MAHNQEGEVNPDTYALEETEDDEITKYENARVAHLVHGCI